MTWSIEILREGTSQTLVKGKRLLTSLGTLLLLPSFGNIIKMSAAFRLVLPGLLFLLSPASSLVSFSSTHWTTRTVTVMHMNDWKSVNDAAMGNAGDATVEFAEELERMAKEAGRDADWTSVHGSSLNQAGDAASDLADQLVDLAIHCEEDLTADDCEMFREEDGESPATLDEAVQALQSVSKELAQELQALEDECAVDPNADKCDMTFLDQDLSVSVSEFKGVKL